MGNRVVIVGGVRTPFLRSGTGFKDMTSYDLARYALVGLVEKFEMNPIDIDLVVMGHVMGSARNPNVARDAMLAAGYHPSTPAFSISQACISSNQAATICFDRIQLGQAKVAVAGGVECLSDAPIGHSSTFKRRLQAFQKAKGVGGYLGAMKGFKLKELVPDIPSISEFSTGLTMGEDCDRLAAQMDVKREDQDRFAQRSHRLAAEAWDKGWFKNEVLSLHVPPGFACTDHDNGVRGDSTLEKLSSLKPAFVKPHGTVTAGNSSFLTDGASSVLIMGEEEAQERGFSTEVVLKDYLYSGQDPNGQLLLGPAFAVTRLLQKNQIEIGDIDVFEFHEAFAGQVLANLKCLENSQWANKTFGLEKPVGQVPMDRLNCHGGSLSIGHPFAATGGRLIATARKRLIEENGRFALIAACAAGGMGSAILLERVK